MSGNQSEIRIETEQYHSSPKKWNKGQTVNVEKCWNMWKLITYDMF